MAPDSQNVLVKTREDKYELYPVAGGEPKPLEWLHANDVPLRFSADGKSLFVAAADGSHFGGDLYRVQFPAGNRTLLRHIQGPQAAISAGIREMDVTPDGTGYAYGYVQTGSALYVVSGLK